MHPLPRLLAFLLAFSPATAALAAPYLQETFDQAPDAFFWKNRGATVAQGRLLLHAEGDETTFVNAILESQQAVPQLNFSRGPVTLSINELQLGGLSSSEKQAFVIVLGSDKPSEVSAASYVRLVFNGDGKVSLSVAGERKEGRNIDRTIVARTVAYPIKQITLRLDRQGYELKITDSVSPINASGKWVDEINWAAWEDSAPRLVVKGVRRPGPGSIEASIDAFSIENK